jgi:hypothetical protein
MNGEVCCILGVCCPPLSSEQTDALARELVKDRVCAEMVDAKRIARWTLKHFDLAPAGSLVALKSALAGLVREHDKGK